MALVNMRKIWKLAAAAAAGALVLSMSACGTADDKTLHFWNSMTGNDGVAMQQIVKDYNATNPEYKVVFQPMQGGDVTTKLYSVEQTGKNIPDLVIQDNFQTGVLQDQKLLSPIKDLQKYQPSLSKDNYLPTSWDAVEFGGEAYGIPLYLYQMVLYYNKDLVKKYNLDYILDDDVVTIDEINGLKGKLPKDVYALSLGNLPWVAMSLVYNQGGTLDKAVHDMKGDVWRKPLEQLVEANKNGLLNPIDMDVLQTFASGKAVFGLLGTFDVGTLEEAMNKDKIGVTNTLQYSADNPTNFFWQANWIQLKDPSRSEAREKASADFIEYVRTHFMTMAKIGQVSASNVDLDSPEYQKLPQSYFTTGDKERAMLRSSNYMYGGYATSAWGTFNDIVYGNVTVDDGLQLLQDQTQGQIQIQEQSE